MQELVPYEKGDLFSRCDEFSKFLVNFTKGRGKVASMNRSEAHWKEMESMSRYNSFTHIYGSFDVHRGDRKARNMRSVSDLRLFHLTKCTNMSHL